MGGSPVTLKTNTKKKAAAQLTEWPQTKLALKYNDISVINLKLASHQILVFISTEKL